MTISHDSGQRKTNVLSFRDRQLMRTPPDSWGGSPSETAEERTQPPHLEWWWTRLMRRWRRE